MGRGEGVAWCVQSFTSQSYELYIINNTKNVNLQMNVRNCGNFFSLHTLCILGQSSTKKEVCTDFSHIISWLFIVFLTMIYGSLVLVWFFYVVQMNGQYFFLHISNHQENTDITHVMVVQFYHKLFTINSFSGESWTTHQFNWMSIQCPC